MNDHLEIPPSRSFGEHDIPSVMVERSSEILTPAEVAVVALTLVEATSSSLDTYQRNTNQSTLGGRWRMAATLGALRTTVG